MKKTAFVCLISGVLFGFGAQVFSSAFTDCTGLCGKKRSACRDEAKKQKYENRTGLNEALKDCEAEFSVCKAGCSQRKY